MSKDWDGTLAAWASPPSQSEQEKCSNAERAVRNAIQGSDRLKYRDIEVFIQGSYANRTNVRMDSDVDVCVLYKGAFFEDYSFSQGLNRQALGITEGQYLYSDFKNDVGSAMISHFGAASVRRGKKAFDVHANTYRVDADVVPCFEHRRFHGSPGNSSYVSGTQLITDENSVIVNWPKQNYANGVAKNDRTGKRFKAFTRAVKSLRYELLDRRIGIAERIPSYLIECLAWNVSDTTLAAGNLRNCVASSIAELWTATSSLQLCSEWGEVNELKYLFRSQTWTREDVNAFLLTAWNHLDLSA